VHMNFMNACFFGKKRLMILSNPTWISQDK
jgi:hypothetical protein